ncbi:hypothetical protein C7M61_004672 [Candidozyma pseudohaemuli]|uniref:Uncharacterized protein n=1 Tax=Candidozyma pseudohaemuli TaxID=418784 RepID=A0A2P7YHH8_9ASCO|nr:hypothetical protein C7M61_004672 [[Candida] pseudohaemulonii]PSK35425.1 hypothetical protein C7M61_004672 [[Candida] pseudohaemulonii]
MSRLSTFFRLSTNINAMKAAEQKRKGFVLSIFRRIASFPENLENWLLGPLYLLLRSETSTKPPLPTATQLPSVQLDKQSDSSSNDEFFDCESPKQTNSFLEFSASKLPDQKSPERTDQNSLESTATEEATSTSVNQNFLIENEDFLESGEWQIVRSRKKKTCKDITKASAPPSIPGSLKDLRRLDHHVVGKSKEPIHDNSKLTQENIFKYLLV